MKISTIFENNKEWIEEKLQVDPDFFNNIPVIQKPEILYIGCADSRLKAEDFMGLKEGDVFVHRNIANQVSTNDLNASSVIHYAVAFLNVKHVVVCGHYGCGGVLAAMEDNDTGPIEPWLVPLRTLYKNEKNNLDKLSTDKAFRRMVELNVIEQCKALLDYSEISKRIDNQSIVIHGWAYDMHTGKLVDLKFKP